MAIECVISVGCEDSMEFEKGMDETGTSFDDFA